MKLRKGLTVLVGIGLFCASAAVANAFEFEPYIIGGIEVSVSDPIARSTVMISGQTLAKGRWVQYVCTGSLIAQDIVVTAAHCVAEDPSQPVPLDKIRIVFGTHAGNANSYSIPVAGYQVHPGWTGNIQNADAHDIAVIRMAGAAPQGYGPAALPPQPLNVRAGTPVVLAGYGVTDGVHPSFSTTGTLRKVTVPVVSTYGSTEFIVDESHRRGSCGGDSGGPAFVNLNGTAVLWGITSRGDENCLAEGVYTRLDVYADYINWAVAHLH